MKKIVLILGLSIASVKGFSQYQLSQGQKQINVGLGVNNGFAGTPIYVGLDYGFRQSVSLGGELGGWTGLGGFALSANANYHFASKIGLSSEWDLYGGLSLSQYFRNNNTDKFKGGLGLGLQIGGRYYYSKRNAFYLEFGGSNNVSGAKIGLSFGL